MTYKTSAKIVGIETDRTLIAVGRSFPTQGQNDDIRKPPPKVKAIHRGSKGGITERGIFVVELDDGSVVEVVERGSHFVYWRPPQ
jgi:hypothetical protein